jgi:hypothetical protein
MRSIIASILILSVFCAPLVAAELTPEEQRLAKKLIRDLGCQACHDLDKSGSTLAGSLERIGLKMDAAQIQARLQRPVEDLGRSKNFMPAYHSTTPDQLKLISRFLANRK